MAKHRFIQKILLIIFSCVCLQAGESSLFLPLSQAGEPGPLTLSQAVDGALKNNPLIRAFGEESKKNPSKAKRTQILEGEWEVKEGQVQFRSPIQF